MPREFVENDDPVQTIYEIVRSEALQGIEPTSAPAERVRQYGVASLLPGAHEDFPFILYVQSVPRPPWSGNRDVHRETLGRVYEWLSEELKSDACHDLCKGFEREAREGAHDRVAVGGLASVCSQEPNGSRGGVYR